jgi:antitoxin ParD1/3/4
MNVSLPKELEKFVDQKVESGRFSSASEVVRAGLRLLEEDDKRKSVLFSTREDLEKKLMEGIESGPAKSMTQKDWKKLRSRVRAQSKQNQS